MKKSKLIYAICILYFCLSLAFVITNFAVINVFDVLGCLIGLLTVVLFLKNKDKINYKYLIFIGVFFILVRISLIFLPYKVLSDDYKFFYDNAVNFANGSAINNNYISLFPYLYFYVAFLGSIMKLFVVNYKVVVIVNLIVELIGALLLYLIIDKQYNKNAALKGLILYLANPFTLLWITKCCPVTIVNTLLLLIIYICLLIKGTNKRITAIAFSILLGLILAITNHFRPIIIIFIITLLCVLFIKLIYSKKDNRKYIISFLIVTITYLVVNSSFDILISHNLSKELPKQAGGWSIYVGSNYEHNGRWNGDDSKYFSNLVDKYGNVKSQDLIVKQAATRYKNLGIKSVFLLMKKSVVLSGAIPNNTYVETVGSIDLKTNEFASFVIQTYVYGYLFIILFLNIKKISTIIRNRKYGWIDLIYVIFIIGLFTSMLLVEVSERYFLPILMPIMVLSAGAFHRDKRVN